MRFSRILPALTAVLALTPGFASAQDVAPASETSVFVFNTLLLFFCGMVVMLMALVLTSHPSGWLSRIIKAIQPLHRTPKL